jgi:hypothetical protein
MGDDPGREDDRGRGPRVGPVRVNQPADPDGRQVFRSPLAVSIWWLWVLFAVANVIDLAIQGHNHLSVVAAFTLLVISGVVYVAAQRPKVVADPDGLTIVNPVRVHRVGWAAIAGTDPTDLLRIRCEWPAEGGTETETGTAAPPATGTGAPPATGIGTRKRAIYAWAVHSSHRSNMAAEARTKRQARRASGSGRLGLGGFGAPLADNDPPTASLGLDSAKVIAALTERAEKARAAAPDARAVPPVSSWHWPAVAAIGVPALALLIVLLA